MALSVGYQRYLPKPLSAAALIRTAAELAQPRDDQRSGTARSGARTPIAPV